jgi:hypothetical protein
MALFGERFLNTIAQRASLESAEVLKPICHQGSILIARYCAVSILLSLQLLSLVYLTCYLYSVPKWSSSFSPYAVLRIWSSLNNLPTLGPVGKAELENLKHENGFDWSE